MGMSTTLSTLLPHPEGEQPSVEEFSATAETFAGRVHVEWDSDGLVTPLGQLPFFVEYLKQAGLFAGWVADCPLTFSSPNATSKHDLLGTVFVSILSGHYRYAQNAHRWGILTAERRAGQYKHFDVETAAARLPG